ncbi:hypothetical protein FB446DRAFT_795847 [Lentinula raphanica]|nr:hypothetical protein FB446DRAFT_795847 [Lentinula raphanica]
MFLDNSSGLFTKASQYPVGHLGQNRFPWSLSGDVGLVQGLRTFPGRIAVLVLLVPRMYKNDPERLTRPSLELMLDAELEQLGAEKHTSAGGEYYTYRNKAYQSGLILMYLSAASLSVARGISGQNRNLLIESEHPFVLERRHGLPIPEHWQFNEGDEVLILEEETQDSRLPSASHYGLVTSVLEGNCEVEHELNGSVKELIVVRMDMVKNITPGDYVKVLAGIHAELSGLVGEKSGRVIGLIPDNSYTVNVWVDVNSVGKATPPSSIAQSRSPFTDIEVLIMNADFHNRLVGRIKRVWPDGHGSICILVYIPSSDCSVELDYTQVVALGSHKTLDRLAQDSSISLSDIYGINRTLHTMKTGREPWIGARVIVVHGERSGLTGTIRAVNVYRINLKKPFASGIKLIVELDVMTATVVSPQVELDYDLVRELG